METTAAGAGGAGKSIFHFPTCGHWLKVSCAADVLVVRASFARADGVFFCVGFREHIQIASGNMET